MRGALIVLAALGSPFLAPAQTPIGGPIEGFTFDAPTRSFRAVVGSLGAASLGPALGAELDFGSVAPRRNYGLSFQGGRCSFASGFDSSKISLIDVPGVFGLPEGVVWSADGTVAVLYSRTDNWIQTVRGLPAAAKAGPLFTIQLPGSSLKSVAIDQTGEHTVIGLVGDSSGVFLITADLGLVTLLSLSKPIALAFLEDGSTLYALDSATGSLSELNMADLTSHAWPMSGLENASALKTGRDATGRPVIYALGNGTLLLVYDVSTRLETAQLPLNSQPTFIETLGQDSFLLGPRAGNREPLWSFKYQVEPVLYFIPPGPVTSEDSGK